jgi:hypothetical protein
MADSKMSKPDSDDEKGGFYSRRQKRLAKEASDARRLAEGFAMLDDEDDADDEEED